MMRQAALAVTAITAIMAATGAHAAPKMLQPVADAPGPDVARISDRTPTTNDILVLGSVVKDSHTIIAGGHGSLALGLLLGPLGVAANVAHADAVNQQRGQGVADLVHNDSVAILRAVRGNAPDAAADARAYELIPAVQLTFSDDKTFTVGCVVSATLAIPGEKKPQNQKWHGRYWVRQYETYDTGSETSVAAAQAALTTCFTEANRLFERNARGQMTVSDDTTPVVIDNKTVKLKLDTSDYPAHVVVPDPWGAAEWPQKPAADPVPPKPLAPCACNGAPKTQG